MDELKLNIDDDLKALLVARDATGVANFMRSLPPSDTSITVTNLSEEYQDLFWTLLIAGDSDLAADLAEHFPDDYAEDLVEDLDSDSAAKLLDHFDSDEQYEILSRLDEEQSEEILGKMTAIEALDVERRLKYERDEAGGIMMTEILVYPESVTRQNIVNDLRDNYEKHRSYEQRYIFNVDAEGKLTGTIPMRKLVYAPLDWEQDDLYGKCVQAVEATTDLDDLRSTFDRVDHSVVPVVDEAGVLLGAVTRAAVQEAIAKRQEEQMMQFGGLISGEELRIMPFTSRCLKRLAFLMPSILLSYLAVGVIAIYEPVIKEISVLAVFLPMVANLSGAAGNQAVAVSIRELTLGLIDKRHLTRVLGKEVLIGLVNGLTIGGVLAGITYLMRPDQTYLLPMVVGVAYACSSVIAVCVGGCLPLLLKRIDIDPAMLSSPMLTTLTDMASFFLVLSLASVILL
ncbi:magnesium transporter [Kiritimatiellota bacterium B12222]|nr:magnesium transporter [Kiritimatiellota bacterium B12222]